MKEWKTRPTDIALWENEIQYILFVDENNGDNVAQIAKKLKQKKEISPDERFLTLTGCIIEKKHYEQLKEEFEFIKYKYWTDAKYFYEKNQVERNVCFHSREIRNKMNAFNMEDEKYQEFIQELSNSIKKVKFKIITVNIDMVEFVMEGHETSAYEYAFMKMVRAYKQEIREENGIIIIEARGKKEDRSLHKYAVELLGTEELSNIKGLFFNAKWNKTNGVTYAGLELADLVSYPIHKYIKHGKTDKAFESIESKIIAYRNEKNKIQKLPQKNRD